MKVSRSANFFHGFLNHLWEGKLSVGSVADLKAHSWKLYGFCTLACRLYPTFRLTYPKRKVLWHTEAPRRQVLLSLGWRNFWFASNLSLKNSKNKLPKASIWRLLWLWGSYWALSRLISGGCIWVQNLWWIKRALHGRIHVMIHASILILVIFLPISKPIFKRVLLEPCYLSYKVCLDVFATVVGICFSTVLQTTPLIGIRIKGLSIAGVWFWFGQYNSWQHQEHDPRSNGR